MKEVNVIYELVSKRDLFFIKRYLKRGILVSIIEPFHAFHHRKGIRFFPPPLPDFVKSLIKKGEINIVRVSELDTKEIYQLSADKAVDVIESVFPEYRKEHKKLFEYVCDVLKSSTAENVFKKSLCDRLAECYSVNILLHRVEKFFGSGTIMFYPDTNVRSYLYLKALLLKNNQDFFEHPSIRFPIRMHVTSFFENVKECLIAITSLSTQTLASGLLYGFRTTREKKKRGYSYGVTIISPTRQLADNQRGPDFIIDNNKILPKDVVYFPLADLTNDQKKQLSQIPGTVYYPPKAGRFFSNFIEWQKLLRFTFKKNFLRNGLEIKAACNAFFNYFRWLRVLENINFRHFITHCDFGMNHVGRNLALNQAGVQTWYFTDSMNFGLNFKEEKKGFGMYHPFWTYLNYDHFVTWDDFLAQYYKDHPGTFKHIHVVGCLWSEHIKRQNRTKNHTVDFPFKNVEDNFILAAFDTTYTRNGITSYAEGLVFAENLLQLADTCIDIHVFLKEKKERNIHCTLDPILGPKLLELYNKIDFHPRIKILSDRVDASELIFVSDMVVSFPFTSVTFEALSVNKPAIWHDPMGYYKNTPYGAIGGVTTHSYEELKAMVLGFKRNKPGDYQNPIPENSPLMDPYRDGKAIDRFRELLRTEVE